MKNLFILVLIVSLTFTFGCGGSTPPPATDKPVTVQAKPVGEAQKFSLAWSEWPGWSVFGVAHELGILDGKEGKLGTIEKKYNVDIILKEMEYDPCITVYGSGQVDAVCLTNMDTLPNCLGVKSVGILPNDTSEGGDMCIVVGIKTPADLKGKTVYGLEKSVSQYMLVRNLELNNIKESEVKWVNMDPAAAATAMQQKKPGYDAIVAWNPFCLQTLATRTDSTVLFDSSTIPGEIIDMVIVKDSSLKKKGGKEFALALLDAYYQVMDRLKDPKTEDETLKLIAEKFSNLSLEDMRKVKKGTKYIYTPEEALKFFESDKIKKTMELVVDFCVSHAVVDKKPVVKFGNEKDAGDADFRFDPTYLKEIIKTRK